MERMKMHALYHLCMTQNTQHTHACTDAWMHVHDTHLKHAVKSDWFLYMSDWFFNMCRRGGGKNIINQCNRAQNESAARAALWFITGNSTRANKCFCMRSVFKKKKCTKWGMSTRKCKITRWKEHWIHALIFSRGYKWKHNVFKQRR